MWPPLAFFMAFKRSHTDSQLARTTSSRTFSHSMVHLFIKTSLFWQGLTLTSLSTIPYMAKSMGLASGEEGGQKVLSQKRSKFSLHQFWTRFAPWAGAESCVKQIGWFPKVESIHGFTSFFKKSKYTCWFIFTPSGIRKIGDFYPFEATAAQIIIESGFCVL